MTDTIAAVATAPGQGGIGIVRLSGKTARDILARLFRPGAGPGARIDDFSFKPRMLHHGWVLDAQGERLDEVLAVWMPGPATATGEDTGEIHCHGGPAILAAVLDAAVSAGARLAGPGEFTYRAFMNGKLDLTQAEAVAEMIAAPSRQGLRLARAKLEGVMGERIRALRDMVDTLRARMTLAVDFTEDDADDADIRRLNEDVKRLRAALSALLAGYDRARCWREGVSAVLAGRVNVGKSSLLNALLGRSRAIVSPTPGTTRDFIEETLDLDGLRLRLIDTAGLRRGQDAVEEEGVRRSQELVRDADCVLLVLEAGRDLDDAERALLQERPDTTLVAVNKIDTAPAVFSDGLPVGIPASVPVLAVSAKTGQGLEELARALRRLALTAQAAQAEVEGMDALDAVGDDLAPNRRQAALLETAREETDALLAELRGVSLRHDLVAAQLDSIAARLDDIAGYSGSDDILGRIFSEFCIGK